MPDNLAMPFPNPDWVEDHCQYQPPRTSITFGGAEIYGYDSPVCGAPAEFVIDWKPEALSGPSLACAEHARLLQDTADPALVERMRPRDG